MSAEVAVEFEHGTYAGYQTHRRKGIEPCPACRKAQAEYMRIYRETRPRELSVREARKADARNRALWRLAQRHPAEFRIYVAEEMAR